MDKKLPMANAIPLGIDEEKLDTVIRRSNLIGLSNNVKWNKLINYTRALNGWKPSYRFKWINKHISSWDTEWYYHLPFPFKGVIWLDIGYLDTKGNNYLDDYSSFLESIGLEYEVSTNFIRVFGYAPKDYEEFY